MAFHLTWTLTCTQRPWYKSNYWTHITDHQKTNMSQPCILWPKLYFDPSIQRWKSLPTGIFFCALACQIRFTVAVPDTYNIICFCSAPYGAVIPLANHRAGFGTHAPLWIAPSELFMLILHYLSSEWSKNPSHDCATTVDDSGLIIPAAWKTSQN